MKVCYVDESGHCGERYNADQPIEVLCGVVTDLSKLFKTQQEHSEIMGVLAENGIALEELKGSEIYRGREGWASVEPHVRDAIYSALLNWGQGRKCLFVVCPIDCRKFFEKKTGEDSIAAKLSFPWEAGALNVVMAIQRQFKGAKRNKGRTFVICDEQARHDERFLRMFENDLSFTDGFTGYRLRRRAKSLPRFDQIVDVPHFSKSHLSVLIQLADLVALVVNRHLLLTKYSMPETYPGESQKIAGWYNAIARSMVTHTSIDAPGSSEIASFYRDIRPDGWSAKHMRDESGDLRSCEGAAA